jgi:hypothetical protein
MTRTLSTLVLQAFVVVIRPLAFVWSVTVLAALPWSGDYLFILGILPAFAVLDMLFQSIARHQHLVGASPSAEPIVGALPAAALLVAFIAFLLYATNAQRPWMLASSLLLVFGLAALANLFEARFSSPEGVLGQAVRELIGYAGCLALALGGQTVLAAVAVNLVFPVARIVTAFKHRSVRVCQPTAEPSLAGARTVFVGGSLAAQILASASAMAPALLVAVAMADRAKLADSLISFKLLFAAASLLSVFVNLFSSRIFYGFITLDMRRHQLMLERCEGALLFIMAASGGVVLWWIAVGRATGLLLAVMLCIPFSYLNLISSLALARGRPRVAAATQAIIFTGSMAFALFLAGYSFVALAIFCLFSVAFLIFQGRERLVPILVPR